jgi:DNA-binding NarL/FixJ family response regulator
MNADGRGSGLYVFLVEDHDILRDVLGEYIRNLPAVAKCVTASNAETALEGLAGDLPDLMLIDLTLPGMNGIELVRKLRRAYPQMPLAILSGHDSLSNAHDALEAGANGYLLKGDMEEIVRGMEAIRAGSRYVSEGLSADP